MSKEYNKYLDEHVNGLKQGLAWFEKYYPKVFINEETGNDIKYLVETNVILHDKSKYTRGEYYAYNEYFWQNATTINLFLGGLCYYLFGLLMISMLMLGSILTKNNTGAILFTGGVYVVFLIANFFTKLESYNPIKLCDGTSMITGSLIPADYIKSIIVMSIIFLLACILGVICFNKKQL